jgi:Fe-S cluster assembly protein SufD
MNANLDVQSLISGLPREEWKYTSLKPLLDRWDLPPATAIQNPVLDQQDFIEIKTLNSQMDVAAVRAALAKYDIEVSVARTSGQEKDSFLSLNRNFSQGVVFKIPKNLEVAKPIVITHRLNTQNLFLNPRIEIEMERDSKLFIAEIFYDREKKNWTNSVSVAKQAAGSVLNFYKIYNRGSEAAHIDQGYFELQDASTLRFFNLSFGSVLSRNESHVKILGKNAHCDLRGLALLGEKNQMDHKVFVHHMAPESTSRQLFKSILRDEAHYVFKGSVRIERDAQKTDANQLNQNLMLDKKCRVDTRPQLDVFADDVKATHGAAIGQIDNEEQFYLETRCLSPETAKALLCEGYAMDIFKDLPSGILKTMALSYLKGAL